MMTYGTVDDVAALVPQYTDNGLFTSATQPTDAQVQTWLDRVSAIMDVMLADKGITVPVSASTPLAAVTQFVVEEVARLVEHTHRAGTMTAGDSQVNEPRFDRTMRRVADWVERHWQGLVNAGAAVTTTQRAWAWGGGGDKKAWTASMMDTDFGG